VGDAARRRRGPETERPGRLSIAISSCRVLSIVGRESREALLAPAGHGSAFRLHKLAHALHSARPPGIPR
jgi:hypothetical protein